MTEKEVLTTSLVLSFVVLMQLVCALVAAHFKKPRLQTMASAVVTGVAAGVGAYPFMPKLDALAMSAFVGIFVGVSSYHYSSKSLEK